MNPRREAASCVERGIERYAEGQYAAAQRELEQALVLHPGHPRALECLAWVREIAAGRRPPSSDKYAAIEVDDYGPAPLQPTRAGIPTRSTGTRIPAMNSSPNVPLQPPPSTAQPEARPTQRTALGLAALVMPPGPAMEPVPMSPPAPVAMPAVSVPPAMAPLVTAAPQEAEKLPEPPVRTGSTQTSDEPESVTREWSSMGTSNLPQLDVPELSEEQIANLLDMDRGRSFTLSAGQIDDSDDDDEIDRTNVRTASSNPLVNAMDSSDAHEEGAVYEMVAEPEDDHSSPFVSHPIITPADPVLTPLSSAPPLERSRASSSSSTLRASGSSPAVPRMDSKPEARVDQTSDDAPSLPTNPFVHHQLVTLLAESESESGSIEQLEAALERGNKREIFDLAEQLVDRSTNGRAEEDVLVRAYEHVVGRLDAVPRYGKAAPDLDSRSAFMLSRMDGEMTVDDLLDVSGMPRKDALRILARLVHVGSVLTS